MIAVTRSAPKAVSRGRIEASLEVKHEGRFLIARLTNKTDQAVLVNKNYGHTTPFAMGQWVYTLDSSVHEINVATRPSTSWHDFDEARLEGVEPGQTIELVRIEVDDLCQTLGAAGLALTNDRWKLHFTYISLCNRLWQHRRGTAELGETDAPLILRAPLPRSLLATRLAGEPINISALCR